MKISNRLYKKEKHRKNTLRKQLLLVLVFVALIPVLAIGTSTYITTIGKITELSLNTLKTSSYNTVNNIDEKINSIDSLIKGVSSQSDFLVGLEILNSKNVEMDTSIYSAIQLSMKNIVTSSEGLIETMYLCDKNGKIAVVGAKNYRLFKDKFFYDLQLFEKIKVLKDNEVIVGNPFYSEELKRNVIPITKLVKSLAGFSGSITALVNYNNFFSLVDNKNLQSEILILDNNLNIIYHHNKEMINKKISNKSLIEQISHHAGMEHITYIDSNVKKVLEMNKSKLSSWIVCYQMNYTDVMLPVKKYIFVFLIVILISLILALIISIVYSSHISKPVVELTKQMKAVEAGCLEIVFESGNSNIYEINSLRKNFYKMVLNLNNLISNINTASKEIDNMTSVMYQAACCSIEKSEFAKKSISNISENIIKQADNTNYASKGIESLAKQIATSRELSQNVYSYLGLLNSSTEKGKEQLEKLEKNSLYNLNNTNLMKNVVYELQQEMKQINTITETIQNIAKQTHLLSLNATIEASRAGESGKGFTIVAKEIKDLSEQTNIQTVSIKSMIENIVINTTRITDSFKEVSESADSQNKSVTETKASFSEIAKYIENINSKLQDITDYLQEMDFQKDNLVHLVQEINASASEIASSSNNVQQYTEEQMAAVIKVHDNSSVFNILSKNLSKFVEIFKI